MQDRNCEEGWRQEPVFVCQLQDSMQREIRGILERILLYYCGDREKAETYFGMRLEEAVQNGMDSKLTDIGCVLEPVRQGWELEEDLPDVIRQDALRLLEIMGGTEPDTGRSRKYDLAGEEGGFTEEYERER